jgi:hypothetical protein
MMRSGILTLMYRQWQELLKQRDEEILTMTTESESTTQTVTALQAKIESMKTQFQDYVRRSSGKITKLQALVQEANDAMGEDGDAIKADGEQLLEDFEGSVAFAASQVAATTVTTTTTSVASRQQSAKKTRGRKKVKDSGIGMDEESQILA